MRIGSLFTGYGGLDMAVQQHFQATTAWTCDIDPGVSKIIAHRYPHSPNLGDITQIHWATAEPVDILTGGWPCQPFSLAGKRKGAEDERALWPEVARAVRALRPRHVILENVTAIATVGELARAVGDLAGLGYVGSWRSIRASDIGAPHGRARIFILAADTFNGTQPRKRCQRSPQNEAISTANPNSWGLESGPKFNGDTAPTTINRAPQGRHFDGHSLPDWGAYHSAIRRWERVLSRSAPPPTEANAQNIQRLSPRFVEWMMGLPNGWVTDTPQLTRTAQLKALGNGVVPQQALAALSLLTDTVTT